MATIEQEHPRYATQVARLWPPQGQWTETDYFNLPDSNQIIELSEGELFIMPPPSFTHQKVVDNYYSELKAFVREHKLGTTAFAPLAIRLWPGKIRQPDIVFFLAANQHRIGEAFSGPPDLAVEVVSPGTRKTDRHDKFYEYAQAGILEYWIVDPDAKTVEVFGLDEGVYTLIVKAGMGEKAHSRLLEGFEIETASVFEE